MTVSRALRGDRYVDAGKRKRILSVARRLGYRPNPAATQLCAQRGKKAMEIREFVGMLVGKEDPNWAQSWKHQNFLKGVQARASQFGYRIVQLWLHEPGWTPERVASYLEARNVRGIVLMPEVYSDWPREVSQLLSTRCCAVIGSIPVKHSFHFAANDDFSTAKTATQMALARGYRRPGFVVLRPVDDLIEHRYTAAFHSVQRALPPENQIPELWLNSFESAEFVGWFQRHRPDVVITHNRRIAVEDWLKPLKQRVPRDVGWITLDIVPGDDQVTGIDARSELVGVAAMDLVLDQMQRDERGVPPFQKGVFIEGLWREGRTLRKPSAKTSNNRFSRIRSAA